MFSTMIFIPLVSEEACKSSMGLLGMPPGRGLFSFSFFPAFSVPAQVSKSLLPSPGSRGGVCKRHWEDSFLESGKVKKSYPWEMLALGFPRGW